MTDNYDALRAAATPEQFCAVLEALAIELRDEAAELEYCHSDGAAGKPWRNLAASLDRVASTFGLKKVRAP